MHSLILTTCGGFLLAVLWMDLMFDVQVLRHGSGELPAPVLSSVRAYYGRVTTEASPMGHLIAVVMVITIVTQVIQISRAHEGRFVAIASLVASAGPILLALLRVVPNAIRLGASSGNAMQESALARSICRDHFLCFIGIAAFVGMQLGRAAS